MYETSIAPPFMASITAGPALNAVYSTFVPSRPRKVSNRASSCATNAGAWVTFGNKPIRTTGAVGNFGRALLAGNAEGVGLA